MALLTPRTTPTASSRQSSSARHIMVVTIGNHIQTEEDPRTLLVHGDQVIQVVVEAALAEKVK